jgi:hypothetical protein
MLDEEVSPAPALDDQNEAPDSSADNDPEAIEVIPEDQPSDGQSVSKSKTKKTENDKEEQEEVSTFF